MTTKAHTIPWSHTLSVWRLLLALIIVGVLMVGVTQPARAAILIGTNSVDVIEGSDEDDIIFGLGDNDRLFGGGGDALILGGAGVDRCSGGPGTDLILECRSIGMP
jgi:hypothetical protein